MANHNQMVVAANTAVLPVAGEPNPNSDYASFLEQIDRSLAQHIGKEGVDGDQMKAQEEKAEKVLHRLHALIDAARNKSGLARGAMHVFGSFSNGFKSGGSDLDIVYLSEEITLKGTVNALSSVLNLAHNYQFTNLTKIFQANVPILKFTDEETGVEVDFCINNRLGARNSLLLQTYCSLDKRVQDVGRLVKAWVKHKDLVGTADGFLNSYAYILLVIYFLQVGLEEPVLPNLQAMAEESRRQDLEELNSTPSNAAMASGAARGAGAGDQPPSGGYIEKIEKHIVRDNKWGRDDDWDTSFYDREITPEICSKLTHGKFELGKNKMTTAELLFTFFHFYTRIFDWQNEAVSIRMADPMTKNGFEGESQLKWNRRKNDKWEVINDSARITMNSVPGRDSQSLKDLWYIEDPYDLRHNLAGKMTVTGKERMICEMEQTMRQLSQAGSWDQVVPPDGTLPMLYLLKCRISSSISPSLFIRELASTGVARVHMPTGTNNRNANKGGRYNSIAFLEFDCPKTRRRAHTRNESYLADCQLQIHYSSRWALEDAVAQTPYHHYDVKAYLESDGKEGLLIAEPGKLPQAPESIKRAVELHRAHQRLIGQHPGVGGPHNINLLGGNVVPGRGPGNPMQPYQVPQTQMPLTRAAPAPPGPTYAHHAAQYTNGVMQAGSRAVMGPNGMMMPGAGGPAAGNPNPGGFVVGAQAQSGGPHGGAPMGGNLPGGPPRTNGVQPGSHQLPPDAVHQRLLMQHRQQHERKAATAQILNAGAVGGPLVNNNLNGTGAPGVGAYPPSGVPGVGAPGPPGPPPPTIGGPPAARAIPPSVMAQRARPRMPVGFNLPDDQRGFPMPLYYNRPPNTAGSSVAQPNHGSTSSNNGNANPGQLTLPLPPLHNPSVPATTGAANGSLQTASTWAPGRRSPGEARPAPRTAVPNVPVVQKAAPVELQEPSSTSSGGQQTSDSSENRGASSSGAGGLGRGPAQLNGGPQSSRIGGNPSNPQSQEQTALLSNAAAREFLAAPSDVVTGGPTLVDAARAAHTKLAIQRMQQAQQRRIESQREPRPPTNSAYQNQNQHHSPPNGNSRIEQTRSYPAYAVPPGGAGTAGGGAGAAHHLMHHTNNRHAVLVQERSPPGMNQFQ
ncbi:unnamed protein product [Amoebophrya sp. A120]|nr:unnamed protein product [Amoebophrya sp. A120]|eukprot:GSA120T00005329001.1